jgi:methyl-accepting chemotaxis protein
MRLTIKTKLALAFGAVVALSVVSGLVGYSRLSMLNTALDGIANGTAKRSLQAAELKVALLQDLRAEKNMILASSTDDIAKFSAELLRQRAAARTLLSETAATATEQGRSMLAHIGALMDRQVALQDQTIHDAALDSGNAATDLMERDGAPALAQTLAALDALAHQVEQRGAADRAPTLLALETLRASVHARTSSARRSWRPRTTTSPSCRARWPSRRRMPAFRTSKRRQRC